MRNETYVELFDCPVVVLSMESGQIESSILSNGFLEHSGDSVGREFGGEVSEKSSLTLSLDGKHY